MGIANKLTLLIKILFRQLVERKCIHLWYWIKIKISGRSNRRQRCQRLATAAIFLRKELWCPGAVTRKWTLLPSAYYSECDERFYLTKILNKIFLLPALQFRTSVSTGTKGEQLLNRCRLCWPIPHDTEHGPQFCHGSTKQHGEVAQLRLCDMQ